MMAAAAAAERCGRDPCGALCPLLAYLSVGYADYAVLAHVLPQPALRASPWCPIHAVTFNLLVLLLLASHTRAVFADPGVVPLPGTAIDFSDLHPTERNSDEWTLCSRCEAYRPPRAHHCRVCHRCVHRMDHHCPWINNCIGELNQKYFIQFLFYTGLTSAYAAGLVLAVWLGPSGGEGTENRIQTTHCIVLLLESLLFGIFVTVVFYDQVVSILTEQPHKRGSKEACGGRAWAAALQEVFGGGCVLSWLCPCSTPSHPTYSLLPHGDV
uniref:Palmitoyltransferase n=1 Tax=Chrysolophus pictus TaxID=9089 RepID=A0A8C3L254_CHRPC